MSTTNFEILTALAFSPACLSCPNRTAACATNFDEIVRRFGEEIANRSLTREEKWNEKETSWCTSPSP